MGSIYLPCHHRAYSFCTLQTSQHQQTLKSDHNYIYSIVSHVSVTGRIIAMPYKLLDSIPRVQAVSLERKTSPCIRLLQYQSLYLSYLT